MVGLDIDQNQLIARRVIAGITGQHRRQRFGGGNPRRPRRIRSSGSIPVFRRASAAASSTERGIPFSPIRSSASESITKVRPSRRIRSTDPIFRHSRAVETNNICLAQGLAKGREGQEEGQNTGDRRAVEAFQH